MDSGLGLGMQLFCRFWRAITQFNDCHCGLRSDPHPSPPSPPYPAWKVNLTAAGTRVHCQLTGAMGQGSFGPAKTAVPAAVSSSSASSSLHTIADNLTLGIGNIGADSALALWETCIEIFGSWQINRDLSLYYLSELTWLKSWNLFSNVF